MALADLRRDYSLAGLQEKDLARDPFRQFETWFQEATAAKVPEPNAMVLSTATREGRPSARTVLLKGMDGRGFMFFTNYESRKGREIEANPFATLVFPWIALERQVIIEGALTRLAREESTAYFHSRGAASGSKQCFPPGRASLPPGCHGRAAWCPTAPRWRAA